MSKRTGRIDSTMHSAPRPQVGLLAGHTQPVYCCPIAADGTWLASASDDKTVRIWDVATGQTRRTLTSHTGFVDGCAVARVESASIRWPSRCFAATPNGFPDGSVRS
jgi:WD40 repeat protein